MACMDYEAVKVLVSIIQCNYPETLQYALVINAPTIFQACWYIIKRWVDPVTVAKIHFIKKEQIEEFFDQEVIPADALN